LLWSKIHVLAGHVSGMGLSDVIKNDLALRRAKLSAPLLHRGCLLTLAR
jgi:hypothetical protein